MSEKKPQVIARVVQEDGVIFAKKKDGYLWLEGHTHASAESHHANAPCWSFPAVQKDVDDLLALSAKKDFSS